MKIEPMKARTENMRWIPEDAEPIVIEAGHLEIRLARTSEELAAAQALRYKVFYQEMDAKPTAAMADLERDFDDFDDICDHLLAFDLTKKGPERVVATYRLLREEVISGMDEFYSSQEFDISSLFTEKFRREKVGEDRQILELGRSCVHPDYRTNNTIQLMWRAIARYIEKHNIAYLFGCASLPGTDPDELKLQLSYLYNRHKTPEEYNVPALPHYYRKMDYMTPEEYDDRMGLRSQAPLIKGYLRLGCFIGDGAVVDEQFGTTDVFILLPSDGIKRRYLRLFN